MSKLQTTAFSRGYILRPLRGYWARACRHGEDEALAVVVSWKWTLRLDSPAQ